MKSVNKPEQQPQAQPEAEPMELPEQVADIFHADGAPGSAVPLGAAWDYGWRRGGIVLSRALGPHTAWSARVREGLSPRGVSVARPVRATDGRYVAGGWKATVFAPGEPAARVDETAAAALRLADALAEVSERPDQGSSDVFSLADQAAWSATLTQVDQNLEDGLDRDLIAVLRQARTAVSGPVQVGHADMLATTIYAGDAAPVVTDLVGVVHPHGYTAAQVIADGLLARAVDPGILDRFSFVPDCLQLVIRALLYRVYVHALLDSAHPKATGRLAEVTELVLSHPGARR
ncbi:TIGR02569 family protein [Corynebacterium uberis]|uniref:TIGR02569 family protein n=1 Tax=Corynebacterium TaxID=1716 RepID=UPI001D0B602F|nr:MULTISPECIES: TIGR02569 family protein [Corynebacterium]MCZ9309210.1 TIGR02569 family protein [Corynebacterium sp. c6VSa_13]UDL72769.1 TIGR02569 family protein [Corynebacterium uberis]UDL76354.1 TIGR02569 family protein [Corynebacterium uberis]UDL78566.1 TIGR02569 family protein [Corynebacterium uberis]UDL80847.1 TIGR02569 family protein [Corynebacterium uberis]